MKVKNNIVKNPEDYAAIYVRDSLPTDNNLIYAQIEECKITVENNNLLLYDTYIDHVSARRTSPQDRKGFSKFLADAKAGCFKTLVVYKRDRLVRTIKDWVELKRQLGEYGVKLIFSDENEYTSSGSFEQDFLENLLVLTAELEPDNIRERENF